MPVTNTPEGHAHDSSEYEAITLIRDTDQDFMQMTIKDALDSLTQRHPVLTHDGAHISLCAGLVANASRALTFAACSRTPGRFPDLATRHAVADEAEALYTPPDSPKGLHADAMSAAAALIRQTTFEDTPGPSLAVRYALLAHDHGDAGPRILPYALAAFARHYCNETARARKITVDALLDEFEGHTMETHEYEREHWEAGWDPYE
ncbi:hypothetical protein ACIPRL_07850 [Streptomyces sp. NPDC090085]|uniref:hypothetical protein n=1 Tax=Streptomyces sp. NPDC090085 TaxID=3365943 RepID=UPI00380755E3